MEIHLEEEQIDAIVRQDLIHSHKVASLFDNDELIKSLMVVIEHYSNEEQYKEFIKSLEDKELDL